MDTERLILKLKVRIADLIDNGHSGDGEDEPTLLGPKELAEVGRLLLLIAKYEREEAAANGGKPKVTGFPSLPFNLP